MHEYQNRKNKFNEHIIIIFKIRYLFCIFNLAFITDKKTLCIRWLIFMILERVYCSTHKLTIKEM
jgi:hypothetical protein